MIIAQNLLTQFAYMDALERYLKKIKSKPYYTFSITPSLATWRYSFSVKIESDFEKAQH